MLDIPSIHTCPGGGTYRRRQLRNYIGFFAFLWIPPYFSLFLKKFLFSLKFLLKYS